MGYSVRQIAEALDAEAFGDLSLTITSAAEPASAKATDLALALGPSYAAAIPQGDAKVAVVWPGCDWQSYGLKAAIVAPRGRLAMAHLTQLLDTDFDIADGVHPSAVIEPGASIGENVSVGPFSFVAAGAVIGDGTRIASHVSVGPDTKIGDDCVLLDGVRIMRRSRLGDRVVIHPNSVIGADGFSWVTRTPSNFERMGKGVKEMRLDAPEDAKQHRIHSLGGVVIGNDVEIGALTAVDAGTIRATQVGDGCKMDNLVQVGHNVILGRDCVLAAKVAIAGSTVVGDRVMLGGRSAVRDNLTIGQDAVITGASVVLSDVPQGAIMMGHPARERHEEFQTMKELRRLPRLRQMISDLQKSVSKTSHND